MILRNQVTNRLGDASILNTKKVIRHRLQLGLTLIIILAVTCSITFSPFAHAAISYTAGSSGSNGAGATTLVLTAPTGVQVGDFLLATVAKRAAGAFTPPAGWTLVISNTSSDSTIMQSIYYKFALSADTTSPSYTWTLGSAKATGGIDAYSGVNGSNPINASGTGSTAFNGNVNFADINTTVNDTYIYRVVSQAYGTTFTSNTSYPFRFNVQSSGGGQASTKAGTAANDQYFAGKGSTTALSGANMQTPNTGTVVSHTLAIAPGTVANTIEQGNYRWFDNADSVNPGAALAAQNAAATVAAGTPFRLRQLLDQSSGSTSAGTGYKLQSGEKVSTCSAATYTDVASPTVFFDNATPVDNATIASATGDPAPSVGTVVYQTYNENGAFTNPTALAAGNSGLWDFSLTSTVAAGGKTYCFRIVTTGGVVLDAYSQYPEMTFTSSGPTLDQQVRGGASVVNGLKSPLSF